MIEAIPGSTDTDVTIGEFLHPVKATRTFQESLGQVRHYRYSDGSEAWWLKRGKKMVRHHGQGWALLRSDGTQVWYWYGRRHRCDGPAVLYCDGTQFWYQNGKLHRDNDLPAIVWADGKQEWYVRGVLQRTKYGVGMH